MKTYLIIFLILSCKTAFAQLNDPFDDGDFTQNPVWNGSNAGIDFIIADNRLRSNLVTTSSNFYLSTANSFATNCTWEFYCNLQFNTSGANYVDVYLISDQADLQNANINGYFVRIGNTDDEISLYKRTGAKNTSVKIIDGVNASFNTSNNTVKIKVTRTAANLFILERDLTDTGSAYFTEGSVTDADIISSTHFGIYIQQSTASFIQKHFFDDFKIETIIPDITPPTLISARAIDTLTVDAVFSEAMDSVSAKSILNYVLNNGAGNPLIVTTTADNFRYRLVFPNSLNTASYILTATNVKDRSDNVISTDNTAGFNFIKPYIAKPNDLIINEILADPNPQIDLPTVEFVELFNVSASLISLKDWVYSDASTHFTFRKDSILPGEHLILCAKADTAEFKPFGRVLGISPWPSLNNSGDVIKMLSAQNMLIDSVGYNDTWYRGSAKKSGGWTLERIDPQSKCEGLFNWTASADLSGGTPGRQNSVYRPDYDLLAFQADSLKQTSDTTLQVYVNKPINAATLLSNSFDLNPVPGNISSITTDIESKLITLVFSAKFVAETDYQLTISNLQDCSGNTISNTNQPLLFKTPATPPIPAVRLDTAKILITEILADPSPEVGLPLAEFIELYNPGRDTIDLEGWVFSDASSKSTFKKTEILPGEYLILCPTADTTQYKAFGKTLGLSPWPSLNNSSDQITLTSFKNRLIDSIAYSNDWYRGSAKKAGGWALERIDPQSRCEGLFNWTASVDISGGTPGRQNSVYLPDYDLLAFQADSLKQTSDTTLQVYVNKPINAATLISNSFDLNPVSGNVSKLSTDIESKQITVTFSTKLSPQTDYELTIANLKDCSGNTITNTNQPLLFKTPATPPIPAVRLDTAKIFITEILADPSPEVGLPLVEFVEIYNPGQDTIDLEGWVFSDITSKSTFKKSEILPGEYLILCPVADTTQYKAFGKTLGLSPWPSLNNSSDQIALKSFKNRLVDSVAYSTTWYKDVVKKNGGWTLERMDLHSLCEGLFNWTASIDISGGTPGRQNSVYRPDYDFLIFQADSLKQTSDTTLQVYVNKPINAATLLTNSFGLNPVSGNISSITTDIESKLITLVFSAKFVAETDYQLTISNLKDCSGNTVNNINQPLTFKTPKLPPIPVVRVDTAKILITEILADPSPEVGLPLAEFVEIYNPGQDTIDLEGWVFSDITSKSTFKKSEILPGEYLILCPVADTTQYKAFGKTIGLSPWPSLNNSSDHLSLKSFKNRLIDSVAYSNDWYKDAVKKNGGWTLERIDLTDNTCDGFYNWSSSIHNSGGTPGKVNSVNSVKQDLKTEDLILLSDSTLRISFNIVPDTAFIKPSSFIINNGIGEAKSVKIVSSDYKNPILLFPSKFLEGQTYTLNVDSIRTCNGALIRPTENILTFSIPASVENEYPIVINEIFADPSPVIGLPEVEFIELFNPSNTTVSLKGLSYEDPTIKFTFPSGEIEANGYLILCPAKDTLNYQSFGKVMGLKTWPSLNNDEDILILKNNKGREIHRVTYEKSWYKDPSKQQGGYSLELINPKATCSGIQNWSAGTDASGGTPGRKNSVYVESLSAEPLRLINALLTDSVTISLRFNKFIDSLSASAVTNYNLNNGIGNPMVSLPVSPFFDQVILKFEKAIVRGNTYKITITNLTDCTGTLIDANINSAEFIFPKKINKNDVLINEILFNPRPNGVDFVEIYNNSENVLNLQELSLATIVKDTINSKKQLSASELLFGPGEYLVLSKNPDDVKQQYDTPNPNAFLKLASMPSFNSDAGTVLLLSNDVRIDQLNYTEKMHFPLIKDKKGVSLERSDFRRPANEAGNFRSAAASVGFATPGYKNSQYSNNEPANEEFTLSSKTFSPDNDGFEDALHISYKFDKPGLIANITVYNNQGVIIRKLIKSTSISNEGVFVWDGLNEFNERAAVGVYIIYADFFDLNGKVKKYRKTCGLATRFN